MKMVVGLVVVLVAAFALPSAFASTKDVITRGAYEKLVSSGAIQGIIMTKTIISNPILEEALAAHFNHKLGGGTIFDCGESCLLGKCYTPGCACGSWGLCYGQNSLSNSNNNKEVKDIITRGAYETLVKSGAIKGITMTKTIVSNPILEEALVAHSNKLGGGTIFDCGESCLLGKCYTPGCACGSWGLCYGQNSLSNSNNNKEVKDIITRDAYENLVKSGAIKGITMTKTIVSNPVLEEALVAHSNRKLGGGTIFDCGESCLLGKCYTPGCACGSWGLCYGQNSLSNSNNNKNALTSK